MNTLTDPGLALYVSAAVTVIVWLGIWWYLWRIDSQARALRTSLQERAAASPTEVAPLRPERRSVPDKEINHD